MYICEKNKIMLKLDVFAGTIANLTDARYFAAREAKWLGFNMDKNKVVPGSSNISLEFLKELSEQYQLIVSFPWETYSIESAVQDASWAGILMRGGEEEKVGFKSFDDLDEILDFLEIEEEF